MARDMQLIISFIAFHLSVIFYLYPLNIISISHFGHWAYILAGYVLEFVFLWLYVNGLARFPGEDITSIAKRSGKWLARILLLPLAVYFFMSFVLLNRSQAELLAVVFLPKTPIWAISFILLILPLQSAIKGSHVIMRGSSFLMAFILPLILLSLFSCFQNMDIRFLFPTQADLTFWSKSDFLESLLAYSPFICLGMLTEKWNLAMGRLRRGLYGAMLFLLPFYFLAVYIPILTFAPDTAARLRFPLPVALDTINIEWLFFDRITVFYVVASVAFVYIYTSVLVCIISSMLMKLYIPVSRTVLCWIITICGYLICIWLPDWETIDWLIQMDTPLRIYSLGFIPLFIYGIGIASRRRNSD